jgi:hypothetical protein
MPSVMVVIYGVQLVPTYKEYAVYPRSTSKRFNIYIENVFRSVTKYFATMRAVQTTILVQKLEKFQSMQKMWQVKICVREVRKL